MRLEQAYLTSANNVVSIKVHRLELGVSRVVREDANEAARSADSFEQAIHFGIAASCQRPEWAPLHPIGHRLVYMPRS
jgi:hypothetical protein